MTPETRDKLIAPLLKPEVVMSIGTIAAAYLRSFGFDCQADKVMALAMQLADVVDTSE